MRAHRRPTVTALIIARDEARQLPDCIRTLGWADEVVVVVDRASRDATLEIARRRADAVIVREFDDFANQRNAGLAAARGAWVFSIDADERATPALASEIRRVIADPSVPRAGYRVPIRSVILGRPFRYSGTQHDLPVRLFRRTAGRWTGEVHETVELRGTVGTLGSHLTHQTLPTLHAFVRKINKYTTLEAKRLAREGRPVRRLDLLARPFWTFAKLYLAKGGFRDGPEGLAFCALSGVSDAVRHWKHRELVRARAAGRAA